jgi:hypothetical protein
MVDERDNAVISFLWEWNIHDEVNAHSLPMAVGYQ